ncbi:MAG: hypothetical protein GPJ22_12585 [Microcystis aeruginosa LL13-03]|jgi:hypothetical protein|nr:hypothetical protein [Microcystis aeruginosa SX13-11]NCR18079.1 hypothetical protein [Microcystis aeruginosa LL13-03]NCR44292.1 hypothetical protein [Microcystis aeruginosa SX13-01]NCR67824.1 hypothetical protein [Microcystis aeruginosa LL11-07]NCR90402.1 hypothetical protein [Microcystis aeruginosa G13-10]NCS16781.1 hypothetical protein [Microcystis aeruginosa G13-12]NCS20437.1 hypothetical protein [Microcystis aeruginosa G11-06]NCS35713.1 hypothetical protein [Microcystis aeruginosa G11
MVTKLIKLQDGTLVEVEVTPEQVQQISGGDVFAKKVKTNLTQIQPLIIKTCQSLAAAWKDVHQELSKDLDIEQAEVELALSFEFGGDVYIAKSTAGANLKVKLILKPHNRLE